MMPSLLPGPRIQVALTPALIPARRDTVPTAIFVVVDVIRATSTLTMLFERGCAEVYVTPDIASARALRVGGVPGLLAGEIGGERPRGFDLGNSPAELAGRDLGGAQAILATTNGTRALCACAQAASGPIYAAALRNAAAVSEAVVRAWQRSVASAAGHERPAARNTLVPAAQPDGPRGAPGTAEEPDIVIVCSGRGEQPAYDDTLCAGHLARSMRIAAERAGTVPQWAEGARIAEAFAAHEHDRAQLADLLASSEAASALRHVGLESDVAWCAQVDATTLVPVVVGGDNSVPFLRLHAIGI